MNSSMHLHAYRLLCQLNLEFNIIIPCKIMEKLMNEFCQKSYQQHMKIKVDEDNVSFKWKLYESLIAYSKCTMNIP